MWTSRKDAEEPPPRGSRVQAHFLLPGAAASYTNAVSEQTSPPPNTHIHILDRALEICSHCETKSSLKGGLGRVLAADELWASN